MKDRSGNSFPVVKLIGHDKPAVLQVKLLVFTVIQCYIFFLSDCIKFTTHSAANFIAATLVKIE